MAETQPFFGGGHGHWGLWSEWGNEERRCSMSRVGGSETLQGGPVGLNLKGCVCGGLRSLEAGATPARRGGAVSTPRGL